MFDLMIIDDDVYVRERLKAMIKWDSIPVRLVCEAGDGETGRELYSIYHPKIVITDIMIPIISGLDLVSEMLKEDPELLVIVVTGYNDFEFAKRALALGAFNLLSKPVFEDTINENLMNAVAHLEKRRREQSSYTALQQLVNNNLPQMQEMYLANLTRQKPKNPAMIKAKLAQLKVPCNGPYYTVALIAYDKQEETHEEITFFLRDTLIACLEECGCSMCSFVDSNGWLNCIVNSGKAMPNDCIEAAIIKTAEQTKFVHDVGISAGIGTTVDRIEHVYQSYDEALTTINYQNLLGENSVAHYRNLERLESSLPMQDPIYGYLLQQFRVGNTEVLFDAINSKVATYDLNNHTGRKQVRNFLFEFITTIINDAMHQGLDMDQLENHTAMLVNVFQNPDLQACISEVQTLTTNLINKLKLKHSSNTNHLVSLAKEFIGKNLQDKNLDMDMVSNNIGLSRFYFCKLFHQVEGISFTNYLKQERINLAKKLLVTTNLKVFEISDACGFSNAKYFSSVFKQVVGKKPLEYQKEAVK